MRRPCTPNVQSIASVQVSKSVSRVTATSSFGSSAVFMGENLVSWIADVRA